MGPVLREEILRTAEIKQNRWRAFALSSSSIVALSMAFVSPSAWAQDADTTASTTAPADEGEEDKTLDKVVVTGMRDSLGSAQAIKRNADTVVDSITASDIGAFPDKSVAEALQRVAGVTVNRFAASDDTAHFSAEPSGVIVRGLQQVRSEFNGRDTFSANSSRGLSWGDVSPELMSGVDTYKNQTAELIEGGIAGTVNLKTRVPFDQEGRMFAGTLNGNYGDIADTIKPEYSLLFSDRWDTDAGEFGFLINYAHSEVQTRSQGIQLYRANRFGGVYDVDGDTIPDGVQNTDGSWDQDTVQYIPAQVSFRDNLYDRERDGISIAGQWRSTDEKFLFTGQYNRSEYQNAWEEYLVATSPADLSFGQDLYFVNDSSVANAPQPYAGTAPFTFDDRGFFQTGTMTSDIGWWGNNDAEAATFAATPSGGPLVNACYGWNGCDPARRSPDAYTATRSNNNRNVTEDIGLNFKWTPNDRMRFNFDAQKVKSEVQNYDIEVALWTFATPIIDLTGERPRLSFGDPLNVNVGPNGLANPDNYYIRSIMDHVEDSKGDELALRADGEFDIDSGWIESIKVGARYADRDQDVRWSGYNWQNVANTWTANAAYFNVTRTDPVTDPNAPGANGQAFNGYPTDIWHVRQFDNGMLGGGNLSQDQWVFFNMDLLQNQQLMASTMGASALGFSNGVGWDPICSNMGDRSAEVAGTCYTPAEIVDVSEESLAGYAMLSFGGDHAMLFGVPVSGNIGVRYVETTNDSSGGIQFPVFDATTLDCQPRTSSVPGGTPNPPNTLGCYLSADDIAFSNQASPVSSVSKTHRNALPSFNIRFDLTDEWLLRFAASRAMSRPDIGNLRNYVGVSAQLPDESDAGDPLWIKDGNGTITGATVRYTGSAQNPFLAPVIADQFDLSLEHYFDDVGSFSFAVFYKKFNDYIQFGTYNRELTNNGVTRTVEVRGPLNGEGASIKGFEVAYQNFFEELPAPFDGLGVQANYTYIDNQGISNSGVRNTGGDGTTITGQAPTSIQVDALEGLSEQSYNLVGMYEKGPWALRLAYNWRSEYLVTAIDCCVAYSIWNEDQGYLDGSIRYRLNDNLEFSLQGQNLLNEETVLQQQVRDQNDGGLRLPNAWFQNDRRFTMGVRFKY